MSKKLSELLKHLPVSDIIPEHKDIVIQELKLDSRTVAPGDLFLAYKGTHLDGKDFIQQAFNNGASAVLTDEPYEQQTDQIIIYVKNLSQYISTLAAAFYGNPSDKQNISVITGTNGKTTCSYLLAQLIYHLNNHQTDVGLISTIGYGSIAELLKNSKFTPLTMTTPEPILLQKILYEYKSSNINDICMEGSSHALDQHRLDGVNITTAVFTNLTHDHLDYHKDIESYYLAKRKLFYFDSVQHNVINIDDAYGRRLVSELLADNPNKNKPIIYTLDKNNLESFRQFDLSYIYCKSMMFKAQQASQDSQAEINIHLIVEIYNHKTKQTKDFNLSYQLLGNFNIYNLLSVIGCVFANNYDLSNLSQSVAKLRPAPGRMESFYSPDKKVTLVVDYAHTPDALLQVLLTLKDFIKNKKLQSKLWCIFGCGGDRDSSKRPMMGKIASEHSDHIIITDDNPRTESADVIIADILTGVAELDKNKIYQIINSRTQAITQALNAAAPNDIILIAGKGHEDYQIYGTNKTDYNERQFVEQLAKKN